MPKDIKPRDTMLSGSVNLGGLLTIRVTKTYDQSTATKILTLIEEARERKAKLENFITRFARYYTPAVIILALCLGLLPPLLLNLPFKPWIYRSLVLLVISCPCALVLSISLSYFAALGKCAKRGILIKGSNFLDLLAKLKVLALDKTGTITKGVLKVSRISPSNGLNRESS